MRAIEIHIEFFWVFYILISINISVKLFLGEGIDYFIIFIMGYKGIFGGKCLKRIKWII